MIFLVVVLHSGLIYEKSSFSTLLWIVYDPDTNNLVGDLRIILDIFIMSTIFFISGFLTPPSLKKKNAWAFVKSKLRRLMLPWLIAVLTLLPLYKWLYLYSRNLPQQEWTSYFHWSNNLWGQNWLWFLPVLFVFDLTALTWSKANIKLKSLTLKKAIIAIFVIGLTYSVAMDFYHLQGWTKTFLLDFQNERLLIYLLFFALGALCYELKIFESAPGSKRLYFAILCTAWLPITIYHFFYTHSLAKPNEVLFSRTADIVLQWTAFHLSLLGLLYLMLNTFRLFLAQQGKLSSVLNRNSYPVYILHVIVMGALAMAMLHLALPSLLKFTLLVLSTFAISNLFVSAYRYFIRSRISAKRVLQN